MMPTPRLGLAVAMRSYGITLFSQLSVSHSSEGYLFLRGHGAAASVEQDALVRTSLEGRPILFSEELLSYKVLDGLGYGHKTSWKPFAGVS